MKYRLKIVFFIFLSSFFFGWLSYVFSETPPKIVISPSSFSKILVSVPNFEGDKELSSKLSPLLRKVLNYHLFILASPFLPFSPSSEGYLLKGVIHKKDNTVVIKAELWDTLENKKINTYILKGSLKHPYLIIYFLCDKVVKDISGYKGIAFSKIVFVKRTFYSDRLYITDFGKNSPRCIDTAPLILFPRFSWQGDKLAYLVYRNRHYFLKIFNLKNLVKNEFSIKGLCSPPVWHPDGKHLFLTLEVNGKIGIYKFDISTKSLTPILKGEGVYQVGSVSKDGRFLAFVHDRGTGHPKIYILDLKTLKYYRISNSIGYNTSPRFSPKGNILLYLCKKGRISSLILYNLKTHTRRTIDLPISLKDPAFSPTGDYIIAYGEGYKGTGLYLIHLDSKLVFLYLPGKNFLFPAWSRL